MEKINEIKKLIENNLNDYTKTLRMFIKQPSISADGIGINKMAKMLKEEMNRVGINTCLLKPSSGGYPVVLGTIKNKKNNYTLLVYGHYDVHSIGNLEDWKFDPFSAEIVSDKIIGRGSADNKGNFLSWIKAIEVLKELGINIPINIIFFFEGEEEIGSPHLNIILNENKDLISEANSKIVFEPRQDSKGKAFINLGWKGMLSLKLTFKNRGGQIHASYGSLVSNPIFELVRAIKEITDGANIYLPGFYKSIVSLSPEERECLKNINWNENDIVKALNGEPLKYENLKGEKVIETLLLDPSITVSAISSGSVDPPVRSVIPESASCLIEFRLVLNQRCNKVYNSCVKLLNKLNGKCRFQLEILASSEATRTDVKHDFVNKIRKACNLTFGYKCDVYPNLQGTSPDHFFKSIFNIPSVGCGCGYHHLCHRPNEFITISQFSKGIELATNIIMELSN